MDTILFDWDGTLVDSLDRLYDAYAAVAARFERPFDRDIFRATFAPDWRLMYRRLGIPEDRIDEAGHRWVEAFEADRVEPFPGVAERLARLAAKGFRLGLVTGGYRDVVTPQLERTGLGDLLPVRVFGDETEVRKPDPEPLRLGLDRLGALADRAAYVGDAPDDMRMAAAVGAHGVGVVSVVADAATLRVAGARETTESTVAWIDGVLAAADGDGR